jgi:hypothetical protein
LMILHLVKPDKDEERKTGGQLERQIPSLIPRVSNSSTRRTGRSGGHSSARQPSRSRARCASHLLHCGTAV